MRALWIADRCREFGLEVVEVHGWQTRGSETFSPRGVVCHHTAGGNGEIPSLRVLIEGRSDLPGPLCQVGLGRSGTVYVVASGRANHAGRGGWRGLTGNSKVFGIEAENRGGAGDPWPAVQLEAYITLAAALITGPGVRGDVRLVCGHKEWALGRKTNPHSIDMNWFRDRVTEATKREVKGLAYFLRGKSLYVAVPPKAIKFSGDAGSKQLAALRKVGVKIYTGEAAKTLAKAFKAE